MCVYVCVPAELTDHFSWHPDTGERASHAILLAAFGQRGQGLVKRDLDSAQRSAVPTVYLGYAVRTRAVRC